MNARLLPLLSLFGAVVLTLHAAQIPSAADPKDALPPALQAGATKAPGIPAGPPPATIKSTSAVSVSTAPKKSEPAPAEPAASAPPSSNASPADSATAPTTAPATVTDPVSASAAASGPVIKPGILSAAKAKGPPPVGKTPAAPAPLSPRFQQVRMKMGALFDTRNAPPAPADPLTNPFRPAGAVPLAPIASLEGVGPAPAAVNNDLASLQQAVATLRVKGTFQRGKSLQLVITSAPGKEGTYKEGDVINVLIPGADPVHLRLRQVSKNSVTLTLGDAEMVLKF